MVNGNQNYLLICEQKKVVKVLSDIFIQFNVQKLCD